MEENHFFQEKSYVLIHHFIRGYLVLQSPFKVIDLKFFSKKFTIDWIGADFQGQLSTVQNFFLEGVRFLFEVGLGLFSSAENLVKDLGKETYFEDERSD